MRIVEIFASKQGEGLWTGVESVFVRTLGCHLRCGFCDTPYAFWESGEGIDLPIEEIAGKVLIFNRQHVVLTGGEPMLQAEIIPLANMLAEKDCTITVETSGTIFLPLRCHLMSISPKLSNSTPHGLGGEIVRRHDTNRSRPEVIGQLLSRYDCQLKFVIGTPADLDEMEDFLSRLPSPPPGRVFLMPMAVTIGEMKEKEPWITEYAERKGYRYCPRKHIEWYGNRRGK